MRVARCPRATGRTRVARCFHSAPSLRWQPLHREPRRRRSRSPRAGPAAQLSKTTRGLGSRLRRAGRQGPRIDSLARAIARREQELLAHSRREKCRLEPEVGSVHDHSEAKHIVAESSARSMLLTRRIRWCCRPRWTRCVVSSADPFLRPTPRARSESEGSVTRSITRLRRSARDRNVQQFLS